MTRVRSLTFCPVGVALLLLLVGCIDPVSPDVSLPDDQVVITGNILSGPGPHILEVRYASAFEQSLDGRFRRIQNAEVDIVDHTADRRYPLTEVVNGRYSTEAGQLVGTPGHRYSMEVRLPDGRTFRSRLETMPAPVALDSLYAVYRDVPLNGRIQINASFEDPEGGPQYYRWETRATYEYVYYTQTTSTYCWVTDGAGSTLPLANDRLFDGQRVTDQRIRIVPGSNKLTLGYQMDVRQLTQTRDAQDYWSLVQEQVEQTGTTFDPPPSPLCGNVYDVDAPDVCTPGFVAAVGATDYQTLCLRANRIPEFTGVQIPPGDRRCLVSGAALRPPPYWTCSNRRP